MNSIRPKTEPYGTPERTNDGLDVVNPISTWKLPRVKKDSIHFKMPPLVPYDLNFASRSKNPREIERGFRR